MHHGEGPPSRSPVVRLDSGATNVVFIRTGDRWWHAISTGNACSWQSIEGTTPLAPDPCWPASPVLTEVSLVEAAGRPAILGLGLAGRSHFSLCVTIHDDEPDTLVFEAACRLTRLSGWLGSTYRGPAGEDLTLKPAATLPAPPTTVRWTYSVGPGGPRAMPFDPSRGR